MDPFKILKRAWQVLWNYRALWIFGIILALTVGGGYYGSGGSSPGGVDTGDSANGSTYSFDMEEWFTDEEWQEIYGAIPEAYEDISRDLNITGDIEKWLIGIGIGLICLVLIFVIIGAIARYVSETALIKMVNNYEDTGEKVGFKGGFRFGWSRTSWRLFLINIIINLPVILLLLFMLAIGLLVFFLVSSTNVALSISGGVLGIGLVFVAVIITVILMAVLKLLRHFIWRTCALEDIGVFEAIKSGYAMVRDNLKDAAIMWLVMIGFAITWAIFMFIAFFFLIPVFLLTLLVGLAVGAVPALIVAGLVSLLQGGAMPWILAAIVGLPIMILVASTPFVFLRGLKEAYKSIVWTMVYREFDMGEELPLIEV